MKNILKSSVALLFLSIGLFMGSCNERPDDGSGLIQHPQNHDHVMGEGLGEGELEAAEDTLQRADTLQNADTSRNEAEPENQ